LFQPHDLFITSLSLAFLIIAGLALLITGTVISLWKHKNSGMGRIQLLGAVALAQTDLDPEGAVLIAGELWRARSVDGTTIAAHSQVEVVQLQGHLLLVRR
jgi:membrane-bound serine protease (ClpP class)